MAVTPFTVSKETPGYLEIRKGNRQSPLTAAPLAYESIIAKRHSRIVISDFYPESLQRWTSESIRDPRKVSDRYDTIAKNRSSFISPIQNKAIAKFREKLGAQAELGTALVESRSALDTITNRATQLVNGYRHLRRGDFRKFAGTFGLTGKKFNRWTRPRQAAGLWLENWFFWQPTISDIGKAVTVLQSPSLRHDVLVASSGGKHTAFRKHLHPGVNRGFMNVSHSVEYFVKLGGIGTIINPNKSRANQLGFVNPISVGWELLPGSFMVDWFFPIQQFINDATWDSGWSFTNVYSSCFIRAKTTIADRYRPSLVENWYCDEEGEVFVQDRKLTLPSTKVRFVLPPVLSQTRAATAVSLLISAFAPRRN